MKTRLITAAVSMAVVIFILFFRLTVALPIVLALAGCIAVFELFRATGAQVNIPFFVLSFVFAVVTPFAARGIIPVSVSTVVYAYFALFAASLTYKFDTEKLPKSFITFVMVCSIVYGLTAAEIMIDWKFGMFYFLLAAFSAFITDAGAYFVGSAVGKTKLAPVLSPKKTVEGAIGGLISSIIVCIAFAYIYAAIFCKTEVVHIGALIFCVILAALGGMIGDLFASSVKRTFNIKDYGTLMPGHGGIMDRCDSLCISLPIVMLFAQQFTLLG